MPSSLSFRTRLATLTNLGTLPLFASWDALLGCRVTYSELQ